MTSHVRTRRRGRAFVRSEAVSPIVMLAPGPAQIATARGAALP